MLLTDTSDLKTWCCPTSHLTSGKLQSFFFFFSKSRRNQNVKFRPEYELVTVFTPQESERQNRFLPSRFHIHLLLFRQELYHISEALHAESKQPRTRAGTRISDQKPQNDHAVFCKTDSLVLFARFASEEVNSVSLHLNLHLFWSAFF